MDGNQNYVLEGPQTLAIETRELSDTLLSIAQEKPVKKSQNYLF